MTNKDKLQKTRAGSRGPGVKNPKRKTGDGRAKAANPVPELVNADTATEKELKTTHSQPADKMEVHHHPQLDHRPKPWKEYLLEGFMIFIAVMMGFIAENIREAIDNNEHVKQLTSQLANELKTDTVQLNKIYFGETKIAESNTALLELLKEPLQKTDIRQFQKQLANSHNLWLFHPSTEAMTAIKNELHLKQFSNSDLIGYFAKYEKDIDLLHTAQDVNLQYQRMYLDPFLTGHFTPANMVAVFSENGEPGDQMRNLTQADLDQLAAEVALIRVVSNELIRDNQLVKNDAVELLKYVTKQYNIEGN